MCVSSVAQSCFPFHPHPPCLHPQQSLGIDVADSQLFRADCYFCKLAHIRFIVCGFRRSGELRKWPEIWGRQLPPDQGDFAVSFLSPAPRGWGDWVRQLPPVCFLLVSESLSVFAGLLSLFVGSGPGRCRQTSRFAFCFVVRQLPFCCFLFLSSPRILGRLLPHSLHQVCWAVAAY